jgi:hypothetical protein
MGFRACRPDLQALASPFIEALYRHLAQQKVVKPAAGFKRKNCEKIGDQMNAR